MSITSTFMRSVLVASLLATGAVLGGCEGDDGLDGAQGPPGQPGETGPQGPEGPPGVVTTKPLESCGVCHESGKAYDAGAAHAVAGLAQVSDVAINAVGDNLDISFKVLVNGAVDPNFGLQRLYRQYEVAPGVFDADRIEGEAVAVYNTLTGEFLITIIDGAVNYGAVDSTYFARLTSPTFTSVTSEEEGEGRVPVIVSYPDAPRAQLVSDQACVNCHGEYGGGLPHGYSPVSASTCQVCHASEEYRNWPDTFVGMVHGIHNSHERPSGSYLWRDEEIEITYPTYMTNCSVCHDSADTLAAANAMPVTGAGCFTCHESMDSWDFTVSGTTFHEAYDETTNCGNCHDDNTAPSTITAFHNGLTTEREGVIWDGADTSVTEGEKIAWEVIGVVDDGTELAISWQASYDADGEGPGAPVAVDPCNVTPAAGAPAFHAIPPLPPVPPETEGDERNNLTVLYTYFQGGDPILGTASAPGQASNVGVSVDNTTCAAGVATTTITPNRVEGATVSRIAIQGKPWLPNIDPEGEDVYMQVRAKTPVYDFVVGSGDEVPARRVIVDTEKCLDCHVGSLYQHGGNRVDNVDMCILCHNSASNEQNVRAGMGVEASEAYDGKAGQTYEMKSMLHAIHSAGVSFEEDRDVNQAPIVIYRNRGIYAWAESRDMLPNWPGEGRQIVFGSNDVTQNHNFHTPTYPRAGYDCGACHSDSFAKLLPEQTVAMATTLQASEVADAHENPGNVVWADQTDDVLQGSGAASCTSCHSDGAAKGHAYQNGWTPQSFDDGRQTIIDATK